MSPEMIDYIAFKNRVFNGIKNKYIGIYPDTYEGAYPELEIRKEDSFYNSDIYRISDGKQSAVLKLTERYRQYKQGICSVRDIVEDTVLVFKGDEAWRKSFLDKNWVLRNSRLKLFNREKYKYLLVEVANRKVEGTEFNLVCTLTNGITSKDSDMLITYELLEGIKLSEDKLFEIAVKNMLCKDEHLCLCGDGYLSIEDKAQAFIPERLEEISKEEVYILPCKQLRLKAAGKQEEEQEEVLEDFRKFKQEDEEANILNGEGYLEETGIGTQVVKYKAGKFNSIGG